MAITDIISEEEIRAPNMEVARGGPEDFMTVDEMDPEQDPELQQFLKSLPMEQAEVLMQLIKEFKAMVAQGFQGEFEDFVKMKMSTAQGGPEDFPTEDEMQIGSEELQSIIPMGQQVAQGGRIGYQGGGDMAHRLSELIKKSNAGTITPQEEHEMEQIEIMLDYGPGEAQGGRIGYQGGGGPYQDYLQDLNDGIISIDTTFSEWLDNNAPDPDHDLIYAQGGRAGYQYGNQVTADTSGILSQVSPYAEGNKLANDAIDKIFIEFYKRFPEASDEDIQQMVRNEVANMQADAVAATPGLGILGFKESMDMITPESVDTSSQAISRHRWQEGGRAGYQYGNQVTADAPGVMSHVSPSQQAQMEMSGMAETALEKIFNEFRERFPEADEDDLQQMIRNYVAEQQLEGVIGTEGAGILDIHEGAKMITPESVDRSAQAISRHRWQEGGRAGYGLGSLVKGVFKGVKKGVKGLTKSIKKFAKSDLGKMALMYMATAGMGNIGANWGGAKNWGTMLGKKGWLSPTNVMGNLTKSWGNIGKAFKGTPKIKPQAQVKNIIKDAIGMPQNLSLSAAQAANLPASTGESTFLAGLGQSFKDHPFPWIAGASGLAGLYTHLYPGKDNIDDLMKNYKGEVKDWDDMIANIRAGKINTPYSHDNTTYTYPFYGQQGGRVGRAEGGLMDLGGLEKDYRAEGGFVPIGGKEKADDVPARLSRNEFVFTADAVRNAGGGDVDRGAEVMENVMTNLEQGGSISEESQGLEGARDMFEVSERLSEVV